MQQSELVRTVFSDAATVNVVLNFVSTVLVAFLAHRRVMADREWRSAQQQFVCQGCPQADKILEAVQALNKGTSSAP